MWTQWYYICVRFDEILSSSACTFDSRDVNRLFHHLEKNSGTIAGNNFKCNNVVNKNGLISIIFSFMFVRFGVINDTSWLV